MVHAGSAAVQDDLAHLIDEGGGGSVDEGAENGELDHRAVAFGDADEARHVRGVQGREGDEVNTGDLRGIRGERGRGAQFRLTLPRYAGDDLERSPLPLVPPDAADSHVGSAALAAYEEQEV